MTSRLPGTARLRAALWFILRSVDNSSVGRPQAAVETDAASWLSPLMHAEPLDVCALVPTGYEEYARIFHPAYEYTAEGAARAVSWAEVAGRTGCHAHAGMQWDRLRPGRLDLTHPELGTLTPDAAQPLISALRPYTATAVWFGVWTGFRPLVVSHNAATFALPLRTMYLLRGALEGLAQNLAPAPHERLPTIAWPDDRSWVLATDPDLRETYLAGTRDCVQAIVRSPLVEAMAISPGQPVTAESDPLNPG